MPYASDAQRRFFNANREKLERQGADVDEWNESSRGKKLPERKATKEKEAALSALENIAGRVMDALPEGTGPLAAGGALAGGVGGGVLGALRDPGEDEEGKRKSRLMNILKHSLGGAAAGAAGLPLGVAGGKQIGQHLSRGAMNRGLAGLFPKRASVVAALAVTAAKFAADDGDEEQSKADKPAKKTPPPAKQILDMDSLGGRLADYGASGTWGGERAGRAQAMADAMGEDTTFNVRHPYSHEGVSTLLGGALGAALGGGVGRLLNQKGNDDWRSAGLGAMLGGTGGLLAGSLSSGYKRRREMSRLAKLYEQAVAENKLNPKNPQFSMNATFAAPLRGPHRTGQVEAVQAMRGERDIAGQDARMRHLAYAARFLPYYGPQIAYAHGLSQNLRSHHLANPANPAAPEKTANAVQLIAGHAAKLARCWKGYEPVPGKTPYSEDSCRPVGSAPKAKKKEKQAASAPADRERYWKTRLAKLKARTMAADEIAN